VSLNRNWTLLLLLPLALLLGVFVVWPAALGLLHSFTRVSGGASAALEWVGLENYARVVSQGEFASAVRNGSVLTTLSVSLELSLGLGLACALRLPFRGRTLVRAGLLIPWLVSPVASGVMWRGLLLPSSGLLHYGFALLHLPGPPNPLDAHTALLTVTLCEVWRKVPLATALLLLPGVLAIQRPLWDHAALEGLSGWGHFRHLLWPGMRPLLLTVGLLLTADALLTAESILQLSGGGPGSATITLGLLSYEQTVKAYNPALGAAAGWLLALAVSAVSLVYGVALTRSRRR